MTDSKGISIPARVIPTPNSISPEAYAFLAANRSIPAPQFPASDKDAWRQYIEQVERQMVVISEMRAKPYPAKIIEHALTNSTLYEVVPDNLSAEYEDKAILEIHGGAFIVGGGRSAAYIAQPIAFKTGIRTFSIDYRMPPDHPFPAGLDDCVEAYEFLLKRYKPSCIAIHGASAGANLSAATILKARDSGLSIPGVCALHTAGVDMSHSGDTFITNAYIDIVLREAPDNVRQLYAGNNDYKDPYLSPVFGDFSKGFPPTILLSGTRDLLLSPTVMMHRALRRAGLEAELHVFEAMPHGGFAGMAPEDEELLSETARFITAHLG